MNIRKFKGNIGVLPIQDEKLRWFLKGGFFAVVFLCLVSGGYGGLKMLLIPYYQVQQLSEQQIAFENELQKAPVDEPVRWQQFENLSPSFHFTNIKIKAAFYSLCQRYDVRLKGGKFKMGLVKTILFLSLVKSFFCLFTTSCRKACWCFSFKSDKSAPKSRFE